MIEIQNDTIYNCNATDKGIFAWGQYQYERANNSGERQFIILPGSRLADETLTATNAEIDIPRALDRRDNYLRNGYVVRDGSNLIVVRPLVNSSKTAASDLVCGYHRDGQVAWTCDPGDVNQYLRNQYEKKAESLQPPHTQVRIENLRDIWATQSGETKPAKVRNVEIDYAIAGTATTGLSLPLCKIERLELRKVTEISGRREGGDCTFNVYDPVRLKIGDRFCTVDVMEGPDDMPPVIGQTALLMLDLVADKETRKIIPNPAHGGEQTLELY